MSHKTSVFDLATADRSTSANPSAVRPVGKFATKIKNGSMKMETLRREAIKVMTKLPDTANIDDIMYELYVIDKVKKAREASKRGETISIRDLKKEIQTW